jgi:hypothetical protein
VLVAMTGTAAGSAAMPGPQAFVQEVDNPWFPPVPAPGSCSGA